MSSPALAALPPRTARRPFAGLGVALAVVAFWWATTGTLVAAQHSAATRVAALALSTALAVVGTWLVARMRDAGTARGATWSFFGGALLWLWVATLLYGGWVVGAAPAALGNSALGASALGGSAFGDFALGVHAPGGVTLRIVAHAIAATLYSDLLGLATIALAAWLTRRSANRTGLWALALFWTAHQAAKLNVFLGVRHPGVEFLPPYLQHLARYFGPAVNSPALPATVAALLLLAMWLTRRARRATTTGARRAAWLLATLATLAAVEHVWLGLSAPPAPWALFLRARGG